ncbi:bifunctional 4-hydroxy-2-oxoglutarate aldolase/2-dehydro-3-deoxy-phosphogluconate aldolase [Vibrio sinaloensis]|uniref:bifunctional 4-hydroxy-2-oxoglutarate aldolase/2-dehydro-3-deoxy-phosphogluconate aldolase n=1 Tax=Photobacterium sp. (strain ATCC 43367) TaxID=379097 RepID=UPI00057DC2AC|nr:bifunctional 4-hydroxy-2-oxoglutarate aldolase/2-dehydro-3-deoxy-phosphogluconate aldolase [Vibrio sinaloensis]KHT44051.1 ketohydroxyglutarate aldolase [Vibrio sinaloensis]
MKTLNQQLSEIKVVPVIAIKDASKAVKLAQVLIENGLPCAEVTFRTEQAALAMKAMREAYPDMLIGAGTVLNTQHVDQAIEAGVDFVVSPGFNPETVKYCQQRNVAIVPGVNNPSLVEQAMAMGLDTLKFFPAEPSGGVAMLKALTAVYPVKFMPTGGVSPSNVNDYLAINSVLACGGTWMVPNDLIDNEKWDELATLVSEVAGVINPQ